MNNRYPFYSNDYREIQFVCQGRGDLAVHKKRLTSFLTGPILFFDEKTLGIGTDVIVQPPRHEGVPCRPEDTKKHLKLIFK